MSEIDDSILSSENHFSEITCSLIGTFFLLYCFRLAKFQFIHKSSKSNKNSIFNSTTDIWDFVLLLRTILYIWASHEVLYYMEFLFCCNLLFACCLSLSINRYAIDNIRKLLAYIYDFSDNGSIWILVYFISYRFV